MWFMFFAALGALLLIFGLSMVYRSFMAWFEARAAHSWPTARGTIIRTWVDHTPPGYKRPYSVVYPKVRYRYEVDGETFESEQVDFAASGKYTTQSVGLEPARSAAFLADFPEDASVTVYHHPRRPERAALRAGLPASTLAYNLGLSLIPIVGGAVILFIGVAASLE